MMMNVSNIKSEYVFTGNPVIITGDVSDDTDGSENGRYCLSLGDRQIYEGCVSRPFVIDVSEILNTHIWMIPEPPDDYDTPVITVEDSGDIANRRFTFRLLEGGSDEYSDEYSGYAFPGGVSKRALRGFANEGTDIFESRFLKNTCNRFMSSRCSSWLFPIKETELMPLYFLDPEGGTIKITDPVYRKMIHFSYDAGVSFLDIRKLRRLFVEKFGILPSLLDIYWGPVCGCRIAIERAEASKNRYILRYRNSFGVFEAIELTGEMNIKAGYSGDDCSFSCYDPVTGDYSETRERAEREMTAEIGTGVKLNRELAPLLDMLASEEVWLSGLLEEPVRVIPETDDMDFMRRQDSPRSYKLQLRFIEKERFVTGDGGSGDTGQRPRRIFAEVFSRQFC